MKPKLSILLIAGLILSIAGKKLSSRPIKAQLKDSNSIIGTTLAESGQGCDAVRMNAPLNIEASDLTYENFGVNTDFISIPKLAIQKGKTGLYEANHDFGVLGIGSNFYSLNRVTFIRKAETTITGI